jgi:pimeloyl-ACP methyl ester carboxylesterase
LLSSRISRRTLEGCGAFRFSARRRRAARPTTTGSSRTAPNCSATAAKLHRRRLSYRGPVLAVWGEDDRLVPVSHHQGVLTAFPHARIEFWPGMGHHLLREAFDDLMSTICNAIEAGSPGAAPRRLAATA